MDFWTRLIGNKKSQQSPASSPQQRLQRFRRAYNPILQLCGRPQTLASHGPALDQLYTSLNRLIALLREESRTPAPHLCLSFAADSQIYSVVARAASTSRDERLVRQAVTVFSLLLESEDDGFVASPAFAKSLMRFALRVIDSNTGMYGEDVEAEVVEILFGVVAKIRVQPNILPVWFSSHPQHDSRQDTKDFAGFTQKDDFPLCYLLIDRIHHDGRIGDFARTGLLYIFEAVSHSPHLEDWIIDSDLPTLMASGLGALYSQLSRELSILHDHDQLPIILALSDYVDLQHSPATESVFSHTHATHMATFLSHLAFWQDVLEHCKSDSVKTTLLDHFRVLFLQQLLYPSLLQSSDTDGGSSVAVLTYLSNIFESLDHPDLTHMILQYLLAIPEIAQPNPIRPPLSPTATRRKSTLMLLSQTQNNEDRFEPNLFSLVDLVLNGVRSQNPQTVVVALKLSSVMLTRHRQYATSTLLKTKPASSSKRTIGALCSETDDLIEIAKGLGGDYGVDEAYTTACQDVSLPLEIQMANRAQHGIPLELVAHEPYCSSIAGLFDAFFTNSVDVNLALTEAVICLACCADVGLEHWLAVPRTGYESDPEAFPDVPGLDEEESANLRLLQAACCNRRTEKFTDALLPPLLRSLRDQVNDIRAHIPGVDYLIAKRIAILGGVGRDASPIKLQGTGNSNRPSSEVERSDDYGILEGDPRQKQRLRSESSRNSSASRSLTPSRARQPRDTSSTRLPSRSSSLSKAPQQTNSIFRPPPPDPPDDESLQPRKDSSATQTELKENEAQILRRKIRFARTGTSPFEGVYEYVADSDPKQVGSSGDSDIREVSLSHVVTNIVILQHFVLEVAAVTRSRAIIFQEVDFA